EAEEEELALIYQLKGVDPEKAREIAKQILDTEEMALETMAREELGFAPKEISSPLKAGLISGVSFTLGAAVPILPYVIFLGELALFVSVALSLGCFFFIGAGRTLVTGRNPWRSGAEMFLIGTLAAIVTYLIGSLVGVPIVD
ncbi:MAG: VIT1/CCC1 transporter family protein, partial [Candidatus Bathyarchaeia archaeon]